MLIFPYELPVHLLFCQWQYFRPCSKGCSEDENPDATTNFCDTTACLFEQLLASADSDAELQSQGQEVIWLPAHC